MEKTESESLENTESYGKHGVIVKAGSQNTQSK